MVIMLAQRDNPEIVRDVCEWLVGVYEKDLMAAALQQGASNKQARVVAHNQAAGLYSQAHGVNSRNQVQTAGAVVDQVFHRHYSAGKQHYDQAMVWFATELRKRVKNDDER